MFASVAAASPCPASGSLVVPAVLGAASSAVLPLALMGGSAPAPVQADSGNGAISPITKRVSCIHPGACSSCAT